jgi:L-threonylcarbamoyladenylate synthase
MLTLPLKDNNHSEVFKEALRILKSGGIVAYSTESFYALGVIAADEDAVKRLFELKKRPAEKPLPIIVGDMDILVSIVKKIPEQDSIPGLLTGQTGKVAIRVPGKSAALYLAEAIKIPITATSANPSSLPPAEDTDAVINYFGDKVDLIIDAGKAPGGRPSTIVDVTVNPPKILREGRIILD